jgi:NAD(P)-dependent dehydrogenase (short-subunit alcohol dehydrogenase family)
MTDQYTFKNPVTAYEHIEPPKQHQPEPGLDAELMPKADLGEDSYRGTGRLEGRRAIVTGADSGIGAATAIAFAREGADVVLSYLPEEEEDAARIANLIEKAGRKAVKVPGDLKDPDTCRELVDTALRELGGLDILVNNAGKQVAQEDIGEITDEQFDHTLKTNVYAMFWLTKAAVPHLPAGSAIINTTSVQAYNPSPTAASRRKPCPSSARTLPWAGQASLRNSRRHMCSWPRRSRASSSAKHSTLTAAAPLRSCFRGSILIVLMKGADRLPGHRKELP